jgi:hypothetical protein
VYFQTSISQNDGDFVQLSLPLKANKIVLSLEAGGADGYLVLETATPVNTRTAYKLVASRPDIVLSNVTGLESCYLVSFDPVMACTLNMWIIPE